jgi:cell wall-associated NlpC family hydrolase
MSKRFPFHSLLLLPLITLGVLDCAGLKPNPRFTDSPNPREKPDRPNSEKPDPPPVIAEPKKRSHDRPSRNNTQERMRQEIESHLGVPYKWGGTTRYGMDCSGFVSTVYQNALGMALPRKARDMYDLGVSTAEDSLQFGDLVFFVKIESAGVSHVGIYIGDNQFAHASTTRGVVISALSEAYYRKRFVGARKILQ